MKISYLKKAFSIGGIVLLLMFAVSCSKDKEKTAQNPQMQMPPTLVKMMTVKAQDAPFTSNYIAKTEGSKAVEVRAQVGGILKERTYTEGSFVKEGEVMYVIAPETYKATLGQAQGSLNQAEANVKQARLNFIRAQNLYKQNAMSQKDYDAAEAGIKTAEGALESARAALSNAKIQLGYTKVVAPVSGYSSKSAYSEGNLISAASAVPLTVINQVDPIYVNFSVPASLMSTLRALSAKKKLKADDNLTIRIHLEDGSEYPEIGLVTFFDKQVSSATGDIKVRAEAANPDMILLPGQFITAELLGFTLTDAIVIPQKSLMKIGDKTMVIVVDDDNTAHYRPVKTSLAMKNDVLVTEGLKDGDKIITDGINKVRDGGKVQQAPEQNANQQQQGR